MVKRVLLAVSILALVSLASGQQKDKSHRPSPPAQAECKFADGKTVHVDYSSPRMKGRKIFGVAVVPCEGASCVVVPYGQVWRIGANEATTFVTDTNVTVGGHEVPAGSYTLFAVPNPDKWTLIINKKTGEWGIPYSYESDELLRTDMKVSKLPSQVENFTITLNSSGAACTMYVDWDMTRAEVSFAEKK